MRFRCCFMLLLSLAVLASCAQKVIPPSDFFKDAPPVPPGFKYAKEAIAAVASGKIELIDPGIPAPDSVIETKDIEYGRGGDKPLLLDMYLPQNPRGPVPALVFIHGGGWKKGDRADYRYYTIRMAEAGYAAFTISYRLSGEAKFPAALEDCKCAIRWIRANAAKNNVDPNRIAAIGGSGGAHLAMLVGYTDAPELEGKGGNEGVSSRVQAVVNCYGPCDLTTDRARTFSDVVTFLGKSYEEDPKLYELASPLYQVKPGAPPTLIIHGTIDELIPIEQPAQLCEKLNAVGTPCEFDPIPGWPHTMDMAKPINERFRYDMLKFFAQYMPPAPASSGTNAAQ
ncbi:MAG: alpha/beta hydrolase [Candidatus Hydrogenedentes bacterium]|nr:alpha/beta hydrolase [Candidatus Hydrogenedentota bacterium]